MLFKVVAIYETKDIREFYKHQKGYRIEAFDATEALKKAYIHSLLE